MNKTVVNFRGRQVILGETKIRCIAEAKSNKHHDYNQFKVGEIYTVVNVVSEVFYTKEGYRLLYTADVSYDKECEFLDEEVCNADELSID